MDKNKFPSEITEFESPNDWISDENAAILVRGVIYFIDRKWLEFVCSRRFYISPVQSGDGYMQFKDKDKTILFHRFILSAPDGKIVDHINRNRRDNREINLRIVHPSQNNANSIRESDGERGLRFVKGKWEAKVSFNRSVIYLGRFVDKDEAARCYDLEAVKLWGKCAITNFPIENYKIPERCIADDLPIGTFKKNQEHKKCTFEGCEEKTSKDSEFCIRHNIVMKKRENRINNGLHVYIRAIEKKLFCDHRDHGDEMVEVFARNLCSFHYAEQRKIEGYSKPERKRSIYLCHCGKKALENKDHLCSTHYKEKYGLFKKLGAPREENPIFVPNFLRKLRGSLGLTQEEFASRLEWSAGYYRQVERGEKALPKRIVPLIREKYSIDVPDKDIEVICEKNKSC